MLFVVILFVVCVCRCQGFPEQPPDTATIQNDPLEDRLASLLREHEAKTASLLKKQDDKWASLLRDQEAKTASLLSNQEAKTASLLRDQDAKTAFLLRDQEAKTASLLKDQEAKTASLLRDQEAKTSTILAELTSLLQQQGHQLSYQEDLLRHQDRKLSHQESLLHEQEALLLKQGRVIQRLQNGHLRSQFFPSEILRHATDTSHPETPLPGKTSDSASHDVITRSDDPGPLEAVASHISQRVTEMGADIQTLKNSNAQLGLAIQDAQSSSFVHWGSSTCSNLSHTVYSGVVGGSYYGHSGAATNYLCLTLSPVFSDHAVPGSSVQYLYGGEYETGDSHENKDPVCAVCQSTLSTTMMIPGTNDCTPGWHLQYSGFLMSGYYGHAAGSEYICVDSRLENDARGNANENGKLLYYTVAKCGSLPCTPYVTNKVVTCAVCSK